MATSTLESELYGFQVTEIPSVGSMGSKHAAVWAALQEAFKDGRAIVVAPSDSGNRMIQNAIANRCRGTEFRYRQAKRADGTYAAWLERR